MLVLGRKIGQAIMIGDDIIVKIVGIKGSQVSVAIDAPDNVSVDREEVRARKAAQHSDNQGNG